MQGPATSPGERRSHALLRGVLAVLVAAGAFLTWPRVIDWQQRRFAEQLAEHAVQSAGSTAASIREMQQMGLTATEPLVQLAAAQRAEVAATAQQALADQLTTWEVEFAERGDAMVYAEQLGVLSGALRAHVQKFDEDGRRWAQMLARRIVDQVDQLRAEEAWLVLAACEAVLALPMPRVSLASTEPPIVAPRSATASRLTTPAAGATSNALRVPRVPATAPVAAPTPMAEPPDLSEVTVEAAPTPGELSGELSVIMPSTQPLAPLTTRPNPLRAETGETAESLDAALSIVTMSPPIDVPSPLDQRHAKHRLRGLSDQQLIAMSETASRFETAAARQLLKSRGYSEELLRITRELQQLPAAERRESLDRAGTLPAAEARRLLRWFVTDADAEVRLHALTLLATTGDPHLAEIARERAVEDADPRVADLAAKLMKR
jgi:hypothetical protein